MYKCNLLYLQIPIYLDGRFSVLFGGYDGFDLSYKKSGSYNIKSMSIKFATGNGKGESNRFFVDCPVRGSYMWNSTRF